MAYWVFLADPEDFGWNELDEQGTAVWDGIKNARAQNNLRKTESGDQVLIYHTAPDKAIIGIAKVTSEARPDPKAEDRVVVDVKAVKKLKDAGIDEYVAEVQRQLDEYIAGKK